VTRRCKIQDYVKNICVGTIVTESVSFCSSSVYTSNKADVVVHGRGNDYHEWGGGKIKCTTRRQVTSVYGVCKSVSSRKLAGIRRTGTGRVGEMRCCAAKVEVSCKGTIAETSKLCDVSEFYMRL